MADNGFSFRKFVSVMTTLSFLGIAVSGLVFFVMPPGRVAYWTGWSMMGLGKDQWGALHIWFGMIFIVCALLHLYYNWKPLMSYLKSKTSGTFGFRGEWVLATIVFGVIIGGTLAEVAPFSSLIAFNESIKDSWAPRGGAEDAPIPHAELLSVKELAGEVGVEAAVMMENMKKAGVTVESADEIIGDLAKANGVTPAALFKIATGKSSVQARGQGNLGGVGQGHGMGIGQMTVEEYCQEQGLDVEHVLKNIHDAKLEADKDTKIRDIAMQLGYKPKDVLELLNK